MTLKRAYGSVSYSLDRLTSEVLKRLVHIFVVHRVRRTNQFKRRVSDSYHDLHYRFATKQVDTSLRPAIGFEVGFVPDPRDNGPSSSRLGGGREHRLNAPLSIAGPRTGNLLRVVEGVIRFSRLKNARAELRVEDFRNPRLA